MTLAVPPQLVQLRAVGRREPAASGEPVVRVRGVSHRYHRRGPTVVDAVDLELMPGRVHCLLGDSGSGKTTLLRLIAGFERPSGGAVSIDGVDVAGPTFVPPERRPVGFVFQDYALFPHLSVRRNVCFGMDGPRRERAGKCDQLLARVGMSGYAKVMPHALSGGQQQRVALARALARDPKVMLLDEPFSGLDQTLRDRVRGDTLDVLRSAGVAVLMVTHDPREAMVCADKVSVMRSGRVVASGGPTDVCVRCHDGFGGTVVRLCTEARAADRCPDQG